MLARTPPRRRFQIVLIKPSHYDDEGYVVQWLRSAIPSNSLAVVYSLAANAAERQTLGPDVEITITAVDECNTRIRPDRIVKDFRKNGFFGLVGLVGVQSNQFPRALDIARPLRQAGIPVVIGGFHVSGCLAMLPDLQADLKAALDIGATLFAGELEGRIDALLNDAAAGRLDPVYNFLNDLPDLDDLPPPVLPAGLVRRTVGHHTSFDAGRGCPFQCSFCTIINVQGRKSRQRSPDDVEALIRLNWAQGIRHFVITDDNFARNKDWEPILDRIIKLREVDRHKINEYRKMLLAWKEAGVITYAGYILGFPADTPESIRADIEIIKRELPLDILEFFCLTPLPGSEDHKTLHAQGVAMDADMNKYDLEHVVTGHAKMSQAEWESIYRAAWDAYYTPDHLFTILRRAAAKGVGLSRLVAVLFFFAVCTAIEGVHPLQGGVVRLRFRTDRRPGMPVESFFAFWPKTVWRGFANNGRLFVHWLKLERMRRSIHRDPSRHAYMDAALAPVTDDEEERLEIFTHNEGARHAVEHARKVAALTHGESAAA